MRHVDQFMDRVVELLHMSYLLLLVLFLKDAVEGRYNVPVNLGPLSAMAVDMKDKSLHGLSITDNGRATLHPMAEAPCLRCSLPAAAI